MKILLSEEQYSRLIVEDTFKWDVEEVKKLISKYSNNLTKKSKK